MSNYDLWLGSSTNIGYPQLFQSNKSTIECVNSGIELLFFRFEPLAICLSQWFIDVFNIFLCGGLIKDTLLRIDWSWRCALSTYDLPSISRRHSHVHSKRVIDSIDDARCPVQSCTRQTTIWWMLSATNKTERRDLHERGDEDDGIDRRRVTTYCDIDGSRDVGFSQQWSEWG